MRQRDDWHLTESIEHESGKGDPFAAAVRATRMPMVITDPQQDDNPIVFCNEAFQKLTGYERDEIIGRNCRFLQGPDSNRDEVARVRDAIEAGTDVSVDLLNYRKNGSTFWNALYLSPVRNDAGEIQYFFASQLDVTERVEQQRAIAEQKGIVEREVQRRTADLQEALEAKTLLLHEVDHRVKNNLTMIGSLIRLQSRRIADPALAAKLNTMLERIDALAAVHRRLYQSDDVSRFDMGAFTANLVADVVGASGRDNLQVSTEIEPVHVASEDAAALGLIVNETLTNAIKHGFADGRSGTLSVSARVDGSHGTIVIADNGVGMAMAGSGDGLGRTLIQRLAKQVRGEAAWAETEPGTQVKIRFPVVG